MPNSSDRKCGSCGSSKLMEGNVDFMGFVPKGYIRFIGWKIVRFLCLDCGYIGHYIPEADLADLRADI